MSNVDTVKAMYEAFGRGDIPAILDKLDDNVTSYQHMTDTALHWRMANGQ